MVLYVLKWSKTPIYSGNEYPRPLSMQFYANGTTWPMANWFKQYFLLAIAQYTHTYLQSLYSITSSWRVLHIIFSMLYYSCYFPFFSLLHETKVFKSLNKLFLSMPATSSKGPVWDKVTGLTPADISLVLGLNLSNRNGIPGLSRIFV
jgi:hypothetical protein